MPAWKRVRPYTARRAARQAGWQGPAGGLLARATPCAGPPEAHARSRNAWAGGV